MRLEDRFWSKVDRRGPEECWPWTDGTVRGGYGRMSVPPRGHSMRSNRLAWILTSGPIPDGMNVLHRCDNPPCCNPAHLYLGTQAENVADMFDRGRAVVLVGEKNGRYKGGGGRAGRRRARYRALRDSGASPREVRGRT